MKAALRADRSRAAQTASINTFDRAREELESEVLSLRQIADDRQRRLRERDDMQRLSQTGAGGGGGRMSASPRRQESWSARGARTLSPSRAGLLALLVQEYKY